MKSLKKEEGKNIWICGGADIVRQLMEEDLIDVYHISILPILLGDGIRLFQTSEKERKLRLIRTESENGITGLVYVRRNASGNTSGNVHENGIRKVTPEDMEQVCRRRFLSVRKREKYRASPGCREIIWRAFLWRQAPVRRESAENSLTG